MCVDSSLRAPSAEALTAIPSGHSRALGTGCGPKSQRDHPQDQSGRPCLIGLQALSQPWTIMPPELLEQEACDWSCALER